ncbi:MAG: hypothetical protein RMM53_03405 [Bacteroidia bacterium]|nr:hypothetical protein [Bacteroidia bacterium]
MLKLTKAQATAIESRAETTIFLAGVGAGKTTAIGFVLHRLLSVPGAVCALFAPDLKVLRQATLPSVLSIFSSLGYRENRHYVVNVRPPSSWNVRAFTRLSHLRIASFANGSILILDGLKNFHSIRGISLDAVVVDEFRDVKPEAWHVVLSRMRGAAFPLRGERIRKYVFTSVPDKPDVFELLQTLMDDEDSFVVRAPTHSNPFLPKSYLASLEKSLPSLVYRREVLAEMVSIAEKPFAFEFSRERHVASVAPFAPGERVFLSFDFNVNPACATAWRMNPAPGGYAECVMEFALPNASLYELCARIRARLAGCVVVVTGDASGHARQGADASLATMYDLIQNYLGLARSQIDVPRKNESHKESWALCNAILFKFAVKIDPSCKGLIRDLETVSYDAATGIDKSDASRGHLLDTMRYAFRTWLGWFVNMRLS